MKTLRILAALASLWLAGAVGAQQVPTPMSEGGQPIEPTVDRHAIEVPRIHARDFEIGLFAGSLSIDSFGTEPVFGLRLSYHLSEDFFLEASYGRSQVSDEQYRDFGLGLFADEDEDLEYYNLSINYNVLPGEVFLGRGRAFTSALFISTGLGNTHFADEDYFTFLLGVGVRVLPTDRITLRLDFRQYVFETDIRGDPEMTYNPELTLGVSVYF